MFCLLTHIGKQLGIDGIVLLTEHNELIRNDSHLLKSDCLCLCSWESLQNPTLLSLLHLNDLFADKSDHNLIRNIGIGSAGSLNILIILLTLLDDFGVN